MLEGGTWAPPFFCHSIKKDKLVIFDKLEYCKTYAGVSENLNKGFDWLINTYTLDTPEGKKIIIFDPVSQSVQGRIVPASK